MQCGQTGRGSNGKGSKQASSGSEWSCPLLGTMYQALAGVSPAVSLSLSTRPHRRHSCLAVPVSVSRLFEWMFRGVCAVSDNRRAAQQPMRVIGRRSRQSEIQWLPPRQRTSSSEMTVLFWLRLRSL
jgi:hypothetical protein